MAIGDTAITLVGHLVADPELRFTPAGKPVCNFRVASNPRVFNRGTNSWEDSEGIFLTCSIWHQAAENAASSLQKGMRVIVTGLLKQRSYQTREGENRTVFEVQAEEVGPSLKFASAEVIRNPRQDQPASGGGGVPGYQQPPPQHQGSNWGQPAAPGGQSADDEDPPF